MLHGFSTRAKAFERKEDDEMVLSGNTLETAQPIGRIATMFGRTPTCSYSRDAVKARCIVNPYAQEKKNAYLNFFASKQVRLLVHYPLGFFSTKSAYEEERLRD